MRAYDWLVGGFSHSPTVDVRDGHGVKKVGKVQRALVATRAFLLCLRCARPLKLMSA